jgi:hypothetical protein
MVERILYTMLMDYRGGTYISLVVARDVNAAVRLWAAKLDPLDVQHLTLKRKRKLIETINSDLALGIRPVPLNGLSNAWSTSALISGGSMLINIVATVSQSAVPQNPPAPCSTTATEPCSTKSPFLA